MKARAADYASVVKRNASRTTGFVLADSGECLEIKVKEVQRIKRKLAALTSAELSSIVLPPSWLLAVILCPDDPMAAIADWTRGLAATQRERVRIFFHPDCDLVSILAPWYEAGLEDPRADEVRDFASFHKLFGNDLNDQIYADAEEGS